MILHFVQNPDGTITYSNWPIKENGVASVPYEVEESILNEVKEGTKDFTFEDEKLKIVPSTKKADREAAELEFKQIEAQKKQELESLKTKLSEGKASTEEIQLALSKLL